MEKDRALKALDAFIKLHPEYEGSRTDLKVFIDFLDFLGFLDLKKATSIGKITHEERKLNNFLDSETNLARKRYLDNE